MRLFTRFTGVVGICLCSIIYLTYYHPPSTVKTELKNAWSEAPRRLIVFGDSWSDNGKYPIDPPPKIMVPSRDQTQGQVWTEWLCLAASAFRCACMGLEWLTVIQIKCNHHDNFARSLPSVWTPDYRGVVVDSGVLNKTLASEPDATPLPDFKAQVDQWLRFEKKQYTSSRMREKEKKGTIFTVWFSLWDLWYYSKKTSDEGSKAISQSMDSLFEQLARIADTWPSDVKIIIPEAMDPTFLPGWQIKRTGPLGSDRTADDQRNAVQLVQQWNAALDKRASDWKKGQIYIYNTNDWMLDQVREAQLVIGDMADHNGLGQNGSPWDEVEFGCIGSVQHDHFVSNITKGEVSRCSSPEKYLFWYKFRSSLVGLVADAS